MNSKGSSEFSYENRYGIKPAKGWKLPATILAIIGIAWVFWAGLFHAQPEFRITLISFSIVSDEEVSIRYAIQRNDSSTPATCTLQAKDADKNVVGEIEDEIARYKEITELDGAYHAELHNKIKCIQEILK